ncbi:MAG: ORC1-type DNA replication protein [Candidatus Undinarchaeales archaeon]
MAQKKLDDLFDNFLNKQSLFKNKRTLQDVYTPETVPHREDQIKQLASILVSALRGEKPSNVFVYGKTGTGKTLVSKYVAKELETRSKREQRKLKASYLNCKMEKVNTSYRLLAHFINELGEDVPATGLPTDQVYKKFLKTIDSEGGVHILILDEIESLTDSNILYDLTRINTELENATITIVGITNDLSFTDDLDSRIKSSLSEEELVFPPYNAIQLQDILSQRANTALENGCLESGTIEKCAALAALEHGDARRALDLLRVACELAERESEDSVTIRHVELAQKKLDIDRIVEVVKTLPKQSQIVLNSIIYLKDLNKEEVATGDVFEVYKNFCKQLGNSPLTQRRVSDLISELDMLGLINATIISKGRYGRTRKIKLDMSEKALEDSKEILKQELL